MPDAINHQDRVLNCPGSLVCEEREGSGAVHKLCPNDLPPGWFGLSDCAGPMAPLLQHAEFGHAVWHSSAVPLPA
eukprot:12521762-Alexandrium_andersonii.AAC.1